MGSQCKSISTASYDAGNRLTPWNRAGADENHSQTWNYDDAGNWNSTTKDGDTEGRNHSVSNQITQLDGKAVSHDLKGNLTDYEYDRTDYRVKYDLDNRIVEVKADSETIRYRYDALGRRIISKGDDETVLIWWGDSECAEYEHRASQDAIQNDIMGHPTRLNSVIARDTEDRENRVELQWYHKNYLDHVYAVSDDNGNLVEHYRYTAFGEPEIYSATGAKRNTSAIGNTVMWNTRRYDADNGLYYYKYRHYKADIGRWLGRDPIEENSGGYNLYEFINNKPINDWDIFGFISKETCEKFDDRLSNNPGSISRNLRRLVEDMKKRGCEVPGLSCECCEEGLLGGYAPGADTMTICYNNTDTVTDLIETIQHEVTHAWQHCKEPLKDDCESVVCDEIQAYLNDGGCQRMVREGTYSSVRECVIEGAANSSEGFV